MLFIISLLMGSSFGFSEGLKTNALEILNAPDWVRRVKVEKVTDKIQSKLEWSTRRIPVYWHSTEKSFVKAHSLGPSPAAVTIKSKKKTAIHMGPQVNKANYERILGHELVHVIFFQKYQGAIPRWLEEGFANHLSRKSKVNYAWLVKQKIPVDVTQMSHPYKKNNVDVRVHYKVSQALVEMLKKKCDLDNLLRLSVQRKMKDYIKSYCNIKDINKTFKSWLMEKSQR